MNILLNLEVKNLGFISLKKLVLADFGISSVMKKSTNSSTSINITGGNGTRDYRAPEVV
jgi:serine/threonine protein kinase